MNSKNRYFCVFLMLFIILPSTATFAERYYMSPSGSDATGDGTMTNPYQSLRHISQYVLTPGQGDTVIVMEGTYPSQLAGYSYQFRGSADDYIVIMADPDTASRPIINGGGMTDPNTQYGMAINARYTEPSNNNPEDDIQYVKIYGLEFYNCYQCITISDGGFPDAEHDSRETPAHHIIIENCVFGDSRNPIKFAGIDTFYIKDCDFYGNTNACIDLVGCHYGTVLDCVFRDYMVFERGVGLDIKGGSKDVTVARCYFKDLGIYGLNIGQMTGVDFFRPAYWSLDSEDSLVNYEAKDVNVYACIFDNTSIAVRFATSIRGKVYNNTIYLPTPYAAETPAATISAFNVYAYHTDPASNGNLLVEARDGRIINNIIYYATTHGYPYTNRIMWPATEYSNVPSFLVSHNLWYCYMDPTISMPDWEFLEIYRWGSPQHDNNIVGNPFFISSNPELQSHFQLADSSPAVGSGININGEIYDFFNEIYIDGLDYNLRPWTDPPVLGAFGITTESNPPSQPGLNVPRPPY